jgi:glutamyl-Q tRNA(Asp) synthetase
MSVLSQSRPVTRFAPSPTGPLHLGHAYAALIAANAAHSNDGLFLLRFEDIDQNRCKKEFEGLIIEDLSWLGLTWQEPTLRQSDRFDAYAAAIKKLDHQRLVYPCFCTRKDIAREVEAAGAAPHGPEGPIYPGSCRALPHQVRQARMSAGESYALRLDVARAAAQAGPLQWTDTETGPVDADPKQFGDIVLARKDSPTSYHLSVVVDDHFQGVTHVTRGKDLAAATHIHRLLQNLLSLDTPNYFHHKLILGPDGKKFSKRDQSVTLKALRESGKKPDDIFSLIGLSPEW